MADLDCPSWLRSSPSLRFSHHPSFLQLNSSSPPWSKGSRDSREFYKTKKEGISSSSVATNSSPSRRSVSLEKKKREFISSEAYAAKVIASAAESHRIHFKNQMIHKVKELRDTALEYKHALDLSNSEKKAECVLLKTIRSKCWARLLELNDPMRAHIIKALDDKFLSSLLDKYQGSAISVDAILSMIGLSSNPKCFPSVYRSDNIFPVEEEDISLIDSNTEEEREGGGGRRFTASALSPPIPHYRPMSPIKLIPGVGYRPSSDRTSLLQPLPSASKDQKGRRNRREKKKKETVTDDNFSSLIVGVPSTDSYKLTSTPLPSSPGHAVFRFDEETILSPIYLPMVPYVPPSATSNVKKDLIISDTEFDDPASFSTTHRKNRLPPPAIPTHRSRKEYLACLEARSKQHIVVLDKSLRREEGHYSSQKNETAELESSRRRDPVSGLWKQQTYPLKNLRPFFASS